MSARACVLVILLSACGAAPARTTDPRADVERVLDDWHDAAASSDLERYMELLAEDAIFLGTDASERWTKAELLEYARAPFAQSRGWVMRPVRRDVRIEGGTLAFFDEDLEAVNLGAARGSGVLRLEPSGWRIVHYNLAITVPNERFDAVRDLLRSSPASLPEE